MKNIKVEWCENFIKKAFEKKQCKGIEVRCFWNMAERSGLWERGTYGTPMRQRLKPYRIKTETFYTMFLD